MIYILIRILVGVVFYIFYKIAERSNCEPSKIGVTYFSIATILGLIYSLFTHSMTFNYKVILISIVCGLATSCAVYSFLLLIKVSKFGTSTIITNLSFLVPVMVSIFIFNEKPVFTVYISFALIVLTFYLLAETSKEKSEKKKIKIWLILAIIAMMASGVADTGPKLIEEFNLSSITVSYLSYSYFFALLPMLATCIKRRNYPGKKEWFLGLGLGTFGLTSMAFLVLTLKYIPATIAYPLVLISANIIIVLLSFFIWKEKLGIKQIFGVITGIAAAVLLNISILQR
jgi:drug/metabolite transporter (DMT)-like permease